MALRNELIEENRRVLLLRRDKTIGPQLDRRPSHPTSSRPFLGLRLRSSVALLRKHRSGDERNKPTPPKGNALVGLGKEEHVVMFENGRATAVICPKLGRLP